MRKIDISKQARMLAMLRISDFVLIIICGWRWLLGSLAEVVEDPRLWQGRALIYYLLEVAILFFCVYTGFRHVGVIDARVWRAYMFAFPMLLLFCIINTASILFTDYANNSLIINAAYNLFTGYANISLESLKDHQTFTDLFFFLFASVTAILGFVAVLLLQRERIASLGIPLVEILNTLRNHRGLQALSAISIKRVNMPLGVFFAACGVIIVFGSGFFNGQYGFGLLGFFLLVRARRYFQVNADSLLAVDKRNPILFLRSFEDDEKQTYSSSYHAFLDFSLETRLSNHFTYFGPFIAIGSPKEALPVPGAARVLLSDSEWQTKVKSWMSKANLIIMYSGKTHWVNWELTKIVETERVPNLILIFPEIRKWRRSRTKDIYVRVEHIKDVFKNTRWSEELASLQDLEDLRVMLFHDDGSVIIIKSRNPSRDSIHLAALIAHYIILQQSELNLSNETKPATTPPYQAERPFENPIINNEIKAMVFCRGCGKEIHETALTCLHCGFVQPIQPVLQLKDSLWMSVTAFILAVMCLLNWTNLPDWNKDLKNGLWIFSLTSIAFAITSIQQKRKGKVFSFISIAVVSLTMVILIGKASGFI